jgi:hypothetical protein
LFHRQNFRITAQTIHKADQIASSLHQIYLLFTRKPEGQRWRRMWRLAAGRELFADFRFDDRLEGTGGLSP